MSLSFFKVILRYAESTDGGTRHGMQAEILACSQSTCCRYGRTLLQRLTGHVIYENVMSFLIVANSLVLGLQALS